MVRGLASGARLSTVFFVEVHSFFVEVHSFFRGPLVAGISSCVRRYFFGRRNPYFCMR